MIFTYASPLTSSYTKARSANIFDLIETKVEAKNLVIIGDLNGKTRMEEDFVQDSLDDHSPVVENQCYIRDTAPCERKNCDPHPTDQQGRRILETCKICHFES